MPERPQQNPLRSEKQVEQTDWRKVREQHYEVASEGTVKYHYSYETQIKEAVIGICFASLCYFLIRITAFLGYSVLEGAEAAELLCATLGFASLSLAGTVLAAPLGLLCLGCAWVIARSLQKDPSWHVVATFGGGITGFLCTSFVFNQVYLLFWQELLWEVSLGPVLATVMGQLGAAWATYPLKKKPNSEHEETTETKPPVRFDIRQALIATAWVAGILTVMKLTSVLGPWSAGIVGGWFVYQAVTMWIVLWAVKKVRGND